MLACQQRGGVNLAPATCVLVGPVSVLVLWVPPLGQEGTAVGVSAARSLLALLLLLFLGREVLVVVVGGHI